MKPTLYIGSDHAGFRLKNAIKIYLLTKGYLIIDCGNTVFDNNDDYPDFAYAVAKEVAHHTKSLGILFCGSAEGMSITANKIHTIRAVVVHTIAEAKLTRQHNNANVLCISGWNTSPLHAKQIITTWLNTSFSQATRHKRRLKKIQRIEQHT